MVQVNQPGTAYGHTEDGTCVSFTGEREDLIQLFHRLRAYLKGEAPAVAVSPHDWQNVRRVERAECPNHMLPVIKGEISYYVPY